MEVEEGTQPSPNQQGVSDQTRTSTFDGSGSLIDRHSKSVKLCETFKTKKHLVGENQERMNYLVQISRYINSRKDAGCFSPADVSLGSLAMAIGRKCVIRMTPSLKRELCKGCGTPCIPAISFKCRLRKNRQKHMVLMCQKCKTIKRFVTDREQMLWCDNPEAVVD